MSNDLISRKAVLDIIKRHECDTSRIMLGVIELPTAYDMDKVVKKLEEKTEIAYKKYMNCPPNASQSVVAKYLTQYQEMASCLKIVKSGITE